MRIQAITGAMHAEADNFSTRADEILQSQGNVSKLIGNMGHDFSGKLPTLMTQDILAVDNKYQSINTTLNEYAGYIHNAVDKYDEDDTQLAAEEDSQKKDIRTSAVGISIYRPTYLDRCLP